MCKVSGVARSCSPAAWQPVSKLPSSTTASISQRLQSTSAIAFNTSWVNLHRPCGSDSGASSLERR